MARKEFYIPHSFSHEDLVRWNRSFKVVNNVLVGKLLSSFCESRNKNCLGFVSETGAEILCCKGGDKESDCWVSVKDASLFGEKEELTLLYKWLRRKGFVKRR